MKMSEKENERKRKQMERKMDEKNE